MAPFACRQFPLPCSLCHVVMQPRDWSPIWSLQHQNSELTKSIYKVPCFKYFVIVTENERIQEPFEKFRITHQSDGKGKHLSIASMSCPMECFPLLFLGLSMSEYCMGSSRLLITQYQRSPRSENQS
jgi:hypothetical protein